MIIVQAKSLLYAVTIHSRKLIKISDAQNRILIRQPDPDFQSTLDFTFVFCMFWSHGTIWVECVSNDKLDGKSDGKF